MVNNGKHDGGHKGHDHNESDDEQQPLTNESALGFTPGSGRKKKAGPNAFSGQHGRKDRRDGNPRAGGPKRRDGSQHRFAGSPQRDDRRFRNNDAQHRDDTQPHRSGFRHDDRRQHDDNDGNRQQDGQRKTNYRDRRAHGAHRNADPNRPGSQRRSAHGSSRRDPATPPRDDRQFRTKSNPNDFSDDNRSRTPGKWKKTRKFTNNGNAQPYGSGNGSQGGARNRNNNKRTFSKGKGKPRLGLAERKNHTEVSRSKVYTSDMFLYRENLDPNKPKERKMRSRKKRTDDNNSSED